MIRARPGHAGAGVARRIQRMAAETGAAMGGTLYTGFRPPADGTAATYPDMLRHDAGALHRALGD